MTSLKTWKTRLVGNFSLSVEVGPIKLFKQGNHIFYLNRNGADYEKSSTDKSIQVIRRETRRQYSAE